MLRVRTDRGDEASVPLTGQSVATFYRQTTETLRAFGIEPGIAHPVPYDLPDHGRPFAEDEEHDTYVPEHAQRAFLVYNKVGRILEEFSATYSGKVSPVQVFWHTFDIATQRYSGRQVPTPSGMNAPTRESYSCEQIASGFWFGDDRNPEPTFYSYTYPEPDKVADSPLRPDGGALDRRRRQPERVLRLRRGPQGRRPGRRGPGVLPVRVRGRDHARRVGRRALRLLGRRHRPGAEGAGVVEPGWAEGL